MNWQLQYVIGFVMLSMTTQDMSKELREKSVNCFNALSWACQEGSK